MAKPKKLYEVHAVNLRTDREEYGIEEAVSQKQAWYFFCKKRGFHYRNFWYTELRKPGTPEQLSLF